MEKLLKRLNELYAKSKAEGLTEEEKREQTELKQEYIKEFRSAFTRQLDNIDVKYDDGKTVPLSNFKKKK